jgi:hypothetical protein
MSFGFTAAEIAGASLAVAAVGAGVSAYSSISAANAQKASADYQAQVAANNATIANYNASDAVQQGNQQLQAARQQASQQQGMIRAVMGAGGIDLDSGSALRTQQGVAQVDSLNQQAITSNAARSAWNYQNQGADATAQANLETMQGNNATTAGYLSGMSSLISGAATTAAGYSKGLQSGLFSS